jgi:hypothetical protein
LEIFRDYDRKVKSTCRKIFRQRIEKGIVLAGKMFRYSNGRQKYFQETYFDTVVERE